ncbi:heat shock factor 2-binding protein-like [Thrips palmi]|uniref:Heat shock factor 2-binding protein-like n=1 Tax=Thrips palmi TaxID=161013 RepID=A0A6P9A5X3_THRPL|nr:heat shock factor 2-binding protein-like [Thrips palmi]
MQDADRQLKDAAEGMDEACRCLTLVGGNLAGLLQDLNGAPECLALFQPDIARLETEAKTLTRNLEDLLTARASQLKTIADMADRCNELEELRSKVLALQHEKEKACAQLDIIQGDNVRLRSQLTHQSTFCASLGSVLGTLVWKASRVPPVVDLLLSGNKAADFLCIVSGTLESFLETFNTEMPGPSADESQFIMAMGGIVTNMAAAPAGRQFLVSDPNGRELILQIIRILPVIPTPSGNCLKRLLLMALYNVSINQAGLSLLHEDGEGAIFSVASNCLKPESTSELRIMALRLLQSLTCDISNPSLLSQVPKQLIMEMANSEDQELKSLAIAVSENMQKAQERVKQAAVRNGHLPGFSGKTQHVEDLAKENIPTMASPQTTAWRLPTHP